MAESTADENNAAIDAWGHPTTTVVSGTAGTSDVGGTAPIIRLAGNPETGALYTEQVTSSGGTDVNIVSGTQQTLGTVGVVNNLATGTVNRVNGGSIVVTSITAGNNNIGNVDIVSGTQQTLGTVGVVNNQVGGTLQTLGTVGVVNNIAAGTVNRVENGTIQVHGLQASGAVSTQNPLVVGGTEESSGEIFALRITDAGLITVLATGGGGVPLQQRGATFESLVWVNGGTITAVQNAGTIATGTNAIGRVGHDVTGIGHGVKTVTTAGTDEALASTTACKKVDIQAQTDNTGLIAVGATGVDATEATGTGIILYAGDTYSLEIDDLADIFIDSTVSGEGVRYTYYT